MYFPEDMNFQYFFFDTFIGYFLQMLPLALAVGIVWGVICHQQNKTAKLSRTLWPALFAAYIAGLIGLVFLRDVVGSTWHLILYHQNTFDFSELFDFKFELIPNFWLDIDDEIIGNLVMFLPFGVLYPLAIPVAGMWEVTRDGVICVGSIEILQPIIGRTFDVNDIILNIAGILISAAVFFAVKHFGEKKSKGSAPVD